MKSRNVWTAVILVACVPLAILAWRSHREPMVVVRFGVFDAALSRGEAGGLLAELQSGSVQARRIAQIVQRNEIDVLLLCELDQAAATAAVFADEYLAKAQGSERPIRFPFRYAGEVNAGEPSGQDLDGDGRSDGPGDAFGRGSFPGQHGMALLSRYPILDSEVRTFRKAKWADMPDNLMIQGGQGQEARALLRLSSVSHWDVPIQLTREGLVVHALCSRPAEPAEAHGARNHDEVRFWVDYLTPDRAGWIHDDAGQGGGLAEGRHFVLLGDLGCDPVDGDGRREALLQLLGHARVRDLQPRSKGGPVAAQQQWGANSGQRGDPSLDTADLEDDPAKGPGNLRLDYLLPSRSLLVVDQAVFWPAGGTLLALAADASEHRLVWADVRVDELAPAAGR
jgi:endonuclease/exonuclease/phosphatase family metal-dependent hydrolase